MEKILQAHSVLLGNRLQNSLESLRIIHSKVCQDFAVETNVLLGQLTHKLRISHTVLACGGVNSLYPKSAEVALLCFTITVCIGETFLIGVLCNRPNILPGKEVTASLLENLLAACS